MLLMYGCGYNGFHQLDNLQIAESTQQPGQPLKAAIKSGHELRHMKPVRLCEICGNASVEAVHFTWSRIIVSLQKETGSYTSYISGILPKEHDETEARIEKGCQEMDNVVCQAATDKTLFLKDKIDSRDVKVLEEGRNDSLPLGLSLQTDKSTKIDLQCVSGGHDKFYCVYDNISFGQFSSPSIKQKSQESSLESDDPKPREAIPVTIHHLDCVVPIREMTCGKEHVLLLAMSGSVFSFGLSSRGQLGHGDVEDEKSPRLIESLEGLPIKAIAAGGWHSVALSEIGDVYVWGWNESGQLGLSTRGKDKSRTGDEPGAIGIQSVPKCLDLPGNSNVKAIACGTRHTVVLTEEGHALTCGWNSYGQLGLGHTETMDKLTTVDGLPGQCSQIFAGQWNSIFSCHK